MLNWINKKRNQKGFTLVELVVVIAILGILAAIAVPKLSKSRENAAIAAHNANVRTLESAATLALSENKVEFDKAAEVEWKYGEKDSDEQKKWADYLQDWPTVPNGLNRTYKVDDGKGGKKDEQINSSAEYKVTIKSNGEIIVSPPKVLE